MGKKILWMLVCSMLMLSFISLAPAGVADSDYRAWDLDMDCKISLSDVSIFVNSYGLEGDPGWIRADINDDGVVDYLDASCLASHYGEEYEIDDEIIIDDVIEDIKDLDLSEGLENSIVSKLENAKKSLEKGNIDAAINQLDSAIKWINAKTGKIISEETAADLIKYIQSIINNL